MTGGASLNIDSLVAALNKGMLVLEATYRSYTPWTGGCSRNASMLVEGNSIVGVCLPDAKGLIGRARWLGRIAVATALNMNIDAREAERPIERMLGSTREASTVRVVVEPLEDPERIVQVLDKAYQAAVGASVQRRGKGKDKQSPLVVLLDEIGRASGDNGFKHLAGNNRLKLAVMGKKKLEEIVAKIPLPPGLLGGFKLKAYLRPGADKARASAAAALLAATPILAGLGAMTSRGFGRFCLDNYHGGTGSEDVLEDLTCKSLERLTAQSAAEIVAELHRSLGEMLQKIAKPNKKLGHTPFLDTSLTTAVAINNTDIYQTLNKIATAVTKQCWKKIVGLNIMSPGANLHTWPLGLPRRQSTGGYTLASGPDIACERSLLGKLGRRLSMIHLYPLPPRGQIVKIVAAVYRARDLDRLLLKESNNGEKLKKDGNRLYHVGRYIINYKYNIKKKKKIPKFSNYHYIAVNEIASSSRIPDPCNTGHGEYGGILGPQGLVHGPILDAALRAALDFVIRGLVRC